MAKEWYRNKTWSDEIKEHFFSKLKRARKDNRAQYLKIQAIELVETKKIYNLKVAEKLLLKMLDEYPEDQFDKSPALHTLGDIYKSKFDYEKALDYYKQSLDFENIFPNVLTQSYLDYSDLIVKLEKTELYDFVEELLKTRKDDVAFPSVRYRYNAILSIINRHSGKLVEAEELKNEAEKNANAKTSGLRYHKKLGVVKKRDSWLDRLLKKRKSG